MSVSVVIGDGRISSSTLEMLSGVCTTMRWKYTSLEALLSEGPSKCDILILVEVRARPVEWFSGTAGLTVFLEDDPDPPEGTSYSAVHLVIATHAGGFKKRHPEIAPSRVIPLLPCFHSSYLVAANPSPEEIITTECQACNLKPCEVSSKLGYSLQGPISEFHLRVMAVGALLVVPEHMVPDMKCLGLEKSVHYLTSSGGSDLIRYAKASNRKLVDAIRIRGQTAVSRRHISCQRGLEFSQCVYFHLMINPAQSK